MVHRLYFGEVMHKRLKPFQYQFQYGVVSLCVDIDELEQLNKTSAWFSLNRFNLVSLYTADFGDRTGNNWRIWANNLFAEYGLSKPAKRIELFCFPRMIGTKFNPISMWYAYNEDDQLIGVIAEVSNTFGQWHHYVLTGDQLSQATELNSQAIKAFHVSPFLSMDCHYHFKIDHTKQYSRLYITENEQNEATLIASQSSVAAPFSNKNVLKAAIKFPVIALKILVLIHWWALKIWLKGGVFHKTPPELIDSKNSHSEMTLC